MAKKVKKEVKAPTYPVEVLIFDCITKQRVVAEYRGESQQWYGSRLYKLYHPVFEGGFRLVTKMGRVLGPFDPNDGAPTADSIKEESTMIKELMS